MKYVPSIFTQISNWAFSTWKKSKSPVTKPSNNFRNKKPEFKSLNSKAWTEENKEAISTQRNAKGSKTRSTNHTFSAPKWRKNRIFRQLDDLDGGLYPFFVRPAVETLPVSAKPIARKPRPVLESYLFGKLRDKLPERWKIVMNHQVDEFQLGIAIFNRQENLHFALTVEIDEPYESSDHILNRMPNDWIGKHTLRDICLSLIGWTTLRFSEEQIARQPEDCVNYILEVLEAGETKKNVDVSKLKVEKHFRWDKATALEMSFERYRERYLDLVDFEEVGSQEVKVDELTFV